MARASKAWAAALWLTLGVLSLAPWPAAATTVMVSVPVPTTGTVNVVGWASTTINGRVDIQVDGGVRKSCSDWYCSYAWDTRTATPGLHTVRALLYEARPGSTALAQTAVATRTVTVTSTSTTDRTPPSVTLRVPTIASGAVSIQATGVDASRIVETQIYIDGSGRVRTTTASATYPWQTMTASNGNHTVRATVKDAAGNVGSATVTVTVRNGTATPGGIPELAAWEAQMVAFGTRICDQLAAGGMTSDQRLVHVYYDQARVMYQIADYTRDTRWNACAQRALAVYRDEYVLRNQGRVPGYWNFTTGLRMHFERTGQSASKTALQLLSRNASYAGDSTNLAWTVPTLASREVAYTILAYIEAENLGEPRRARRAQLVTHAYGHLDQWFTRFTWRGKTEQVAPFMVALTAHSLIADWEETRDARLIPALRRAADWLWANAWDDGEDAMLLDVNAAPGKAVYAPDLNLLIAPMYAFLYRQTGLAQYRDQGDALFAGGVREPFLTTGKHFDQNYWWSFDYVKWRRGS
jgi:hypothetical protein